MTQQQFNAKVSDDIRRMIQNSKNALPPIQSLSVENSSSIAHMGFEESTGRLYLTFKSGACYLYTDVSKEAWDKFAGAESKGKHFAAEFSRRYAGRKL